ncbi:MAG: bis(5'-nucleosyl)-tetraphosphatase (symmetrical) YqeK [Lachnospiraceae bacterium]|nr:bis(5'-nucleosyl)-tetraphosphatase (symmetrical) YqeK [Lachnospiraceae bacterium]
MLKDSLSHKRYMHSIGVSDTAACLAMRYGYDMEKARLAGLLHDCAKALGTDELIRTVREAKIETSPIEEENPELLHAKAGSVIASKRYEVDDQEIIGAIFYHTTGRPEMTWLEKIIFLADYIEPNRVDIPELEKIRKQAFTEMNEAVAMCCRNSIEHLKRNSRMIDRITIDTYEYYRENSNYNE